MVVIIERECDGGWQVPMALRHGNTGAVTSALLTRTPQVPQFKTEEFLVPIMMETDAWHGTNSERLQPLTSTSA